MITLNEIVKKSARGSWQRHWGEEIVFTTAPVQPFINLRWISRYRESWKNFCKRLNENLPSYYNIYFLSGKRGGWYSSKWMILHADEDEVEISNTETGFLEEEIWRKVS